MEHRLYYEFSVIDDGPGIPEESHELVFEMFQTLADDKSDNTGIGLALVKKIIGAEGGTLWLDRGNQKGCKFCFTWPKRAALNRYRFYPK